MEKWMQVTGFDKYEVSNLGNIRSNRCILKPGYDTYGYRQVNLYKDGTRYTRKIYRLVLNAFSPNIENKPQVDHINRIRHDDRLENLRWVTARENVRNSKDFTEEMNGISRSEKNNTYIIRLNIDGQEKYFGSRKTLDEAKSLRNDVLAGKFDYIPRNQRDTYGISLLRNRGLYQVRVNKKTIGYTKTFDEAKRLRDENNLNNNENSQL
jgi:hypothetical protein